MNRNASPRNARLALAALSALSLAACADGPRSTDTPLSPDAPRLSVFDGAVETGVLTTRDSDLAPVISGTRIAYRGPGSGGADVLVYDLGTGRTTRILPDSAMQDDPAISGDYVVYEDLSTGRLEIRAHDLRTGENFQISPTGTPSTNRAEYDPAISGTRVVFSTIPGDGSGGIYLFDLATRTGRLFRGGPVGTGLTEVDIGGDLVVWREAWGSPGVIAIMLHDLRTGVTREIARTTGNLAGMGNPATDGARVVYEEYRDGNWDVFLFDPATDSTTRITRHASPQRYPDIDGNVIVWEDHRAGQGNADIYGFDLSTGTEHPVTRAPLNQFRPSISGNRIVWQDVRPYDQSDVYMLTLAGF